MARKYYTMKTSVLCTYHFLVFIRILTIAQSHNHLFYIYDDSNWSAIANSSYHIRNDPYEILNVTMNNGAGPLVNATNGLYHTDQYQLFLLYYFRLLRDRRRTLDPSQATTFIIPYDIASDCAYYKYCQNLNSKHKTCFDFRKCPLANQVSSLLQNSSWYHRRHGYDHVLIIGFNYAMEHYLLKPKCKALLTGTCYNCTKLAIDDYSFLYGTNDGSINKGINWHAVPFPSDFHWTRQVLPPYPWENRNRSILVSYIGSDQSYYTPARKLRRALVSSCHQHNTLCYHNTYGQNGTRSSFMVTGHTPHLISQQSIFCFQPIGDLMTRKGLFDSLVQGCIPVTFHPLTASAMYTTHWSEDLWNDVLVHIPMISVIHQQIDPVSYLHNLFIYNHSLILRKQALIRDNVFQLQYSLEGRYIKEYVPWSKINRIDYDSRTFVLDEFDNYLYTQYNTTDSHHQYLSTPISKALLNISQPFYWPTYTDTSTNTDTTTTTTTTSNMTRYMQDAYDITISAVLGWHSGTVLDIRNATTPYCWSGILNQSAMQGKGMCVPSVPVH